MAYKTLVRKAAIVAANNNANNASSVPTYIGAMQIFSVKENTQVLFDETIDCDGLIDLDGLLTEV